MTDPWMGTETSKSGKPKTDSVVGSALASLVPLIRRTGATVAVAGVDNAEQADWWRHVGVDFARGAAFVQPVEPDAVPALLVTGR
ncbi:MAG: hypothetical protein ACRDTX_13510 [Pseudonocardiaceae bacterium]